MSQQYYDLSELQSFCKRDPEGYKEDFLTQKAHFEARLELFKTNDQVSSPDLQRLIMYVAQMGAIYKSYTREIYVAIFELSKERAMTMHRDVRLCCAKSLAMMHNKDLMNGQDFMELCEHFFALYGLEDTDVRGVAYNFVIRRIQTNYRTDAGVLKFVIHSLNSPEYSVCRMSIRLLIDCFRKRVYDGQKTATLVNAVSNMCFHKAEKIMQEAFAFFLDQEKVADESDTLEVKRGITGKSHEIQRIMLTIGKKTRNKRKEERKLAHMQEQLENMKRRQAPDLDARVATNAAIDALRDPEAFAVALSAIIPASVPGRKARYKLKTRVTAVRLVSRVLAHHRLYCQEFFDGVIGYVQPRQSDVTALLSYVAQAVHPDVPPAAIQPVVRTIADTFIVPGNRAEFSVIGLNAVREIAARQPDVFTDVGGEDGTVGNAELLQELLERKTDKDNGIAAAAGGLLTLYRAINPGLLKRSQRGKQAEYDLRKGNVRAVSFGQRGAVTGIQGADLLDPAAPPEANPEDVARWAVGSDSDEEDDVWEEEAMDVDEDEMDMMDKEMGHDVEEAQAVEKEAGERADGARILTDADFMKLEEIQATQQALDVAKAVGKEIDPCELLAGAKHTRMSREAIIQHHKDSLVGNEGHGSKRGKNKGGGSTNRQKIHNKNQVMLAHSDRVKDKVFRSGRKKRLIADKHADWQRRKYKPKTR